MRVYPVTILRMFVVLTCVVLLLVLLRQRTALVFKNDLVYNNKWSTVPMDDRSAQNFNSRAIDPLSGHNNNSGKTNASRVDDNRGEDSNNTDRVREAKQRTTPQPAPIIKADPLPKLVTITNASSIVSRYRINNENLCGFFNRSKTSLLLIIPSLSNHYEQRKAIRHTWGSFVKTSDIAVARLFVLGSMILRKQTEDMQNLLVQESEKYQDIVQGDFIDSYHNLTLKSIVALNWVKEFCSSATFVLKIDDDMFMNRHDLANFLTKTAPRQNIFTGKCSSNGKPHREEKSKYYMPEWMFDGKVYPPFCFGPAYLMSGDVARQLADVTIRTPFVYLEDVFMGICLKALGITPQNDKRFTNTFLPYSYCAYRNLFTVHKAIKFTYEIERDIEIGMHLKKLCPKQKQKIRTLITDVVGQR